MSTRSFLDVPLAGFDANSPDSVHAIAQSPLSSYPSSSTSPEASGSGVHSEPYQPEHGSDQAGSSRSSSSSPTPQSSTTSRRRVRPKIDLAPGQPPTARGNPRIRVFVACYQCRARKIRCDGAKPICHNCQKRPSGAEQCSYDSGPNRRGRDKGSSRAKPPTQSGTGKRAANRQRSPLATNSEHHDDPDPIQVDASEDLPEAVAAWDYSPHAEDDLQLETDLLGLSDEMLWDFDVMMQDVSASNEILQALDSQLAIVPAVTTTPPEAEQEQEQEATIPSRPSVQFARDTWWDALVTFYATEREVTSDLQLNVISPTQRSAAMKAMMSDLKALLQASPCWVSFLHLPRFFDTLFNPVRRHSLQPSVLLAALALGILSQSSEVDRGARGRQKALKLLEMAHGALEGALATGWVDVGLAQAALLIVYFEMQSHPLQTLQRSQSALLLLDSLVRLFALPSIDEGIKPRGRSPFAGLQNTAYNTFNPAAQLNAMSHQAQTIAMQTNSVFSNTNNSSSRNSPSPQSGAPSHSPPSTSSSPSSIHSHPSGCTCISYSLGQNWPSVYDLAPSWKSTVMWPEGLSEADFRREECRRLVWACVMVIANVSTYTSATPDSLLRLGRLFVGEPENFALLMPGEALAASGTVIPQDDIWTLSMRTMLLLHRTIRVRENYDLSPADRAQLAVQAWLEVEDLEARIGRHTCHLDEAFGFQAQELLFGLRMLTSYDFQNFIPQVTTTGSTLFYRDKAEAWLRYIDDVSNLVWQSLSVANQHPSRDHRKSLIIYWLVSSIKRCLSLWMHDPGMIYALEVARGNVQRTEYLMMLWPNMRLRQLWQGLRMQLVEACLKAGIPPPSPSMPRIPRPQAAEPTT